VFKFCQPVKYWSRAFGLKIAAALLSAGVLVLASPMPVAALRNGTELKYDEYPNGFGAVALLEADNTARPGYDFKCLAVFVDVDLLLTAGHCLRGAKTRFRVRAPINPDQSDFETIAVKDFRWHPDTNAGEQGDQYKEFTATRSGKYHDIGVIHLEVESNYARPMTLVPGDIDIQNLVRPKISIFGRLRDDVFRDLGKIGFGQMEAPFPMPGGSNIYVARMKRDLGGDVASICVGDSGAPVTLGAKSEDGSVDSVHYLLGIFTMNSDAVLPDPSRIDRALKVWGNLDNVPACGLDAGYTSIVSELAWIKATIQELKPGESSPLRIFGEDAPREKGEVISRSLVKAEPPKAPRGARVEENTVLNGDLSGKTFNMVPRSTLKSCQDACSADAKCSAYTYDKWNRLCLLKEKSGEIMLNPRAISGYKDGRETKVYSSAPKIYEYYNKKGFPRDGEVKVKSFSRDGCRDECTRSKSITCVAFSFEKSSNACHLYSETDAYISRAGFESGTLTQVP